MKEIIKKFIVFFSMTLVSYSCCLALGDETKTRENTKQTSYSSIYPSSHILKLAKNSLKKAKSQGIVSSSVMAIVDFTKPSTEKRLWIIDLATNKILYNTWVAHGINSGIIYPKNFSNTPTSHKSSIGLFLSSGKYIGKHGLSLSLEGLEKGFNHNAASRGIIVHSASYASKKFLDAHGRLGRSMGCFSLDPKIGPEIINAIEKGSLLFAYYPDEEWLSKSNFIRL